MGKPLRNAKMERQWAEGVSVYDTLEYALAQIRLHRFKLGRYVVAVRISSEPDIAVEQSSNDPQHYTLYAPPERLRALAGTPALVEEC